MDVTNAADVVVMLLRQLGSIAILSQGGGVFAVIWWLAGCQGLFFVVYAVGAARLFSPAALVPGFSAAAIRRNLRYALGAMGVTIFGVIRVQGDRAIVSKMLPLGTLGVYSFAYGAAWKGRLLATAISRAALPSFSALFAAGQRDALMSQYRKLHDVVCWSMAPSLAVLPFAAAPLFTFVFSRGTAGVMHVPVALLCLGTYMSNTLAVPHTLVMASGRPGIVVRFTSRAVLVVLPATALLIYRYGLVGAALSCACYPVAVYLCVVPRICRVCTDFSAWTWYRHIARVLAAIALTYGAAWGVLFRLDLQSIPALALAYSAATMVYGIAAWLMIGPELKGTIKGHASRLFGGAKRGGAEPREGE
jgi:O-antigen/teichoic acid export membrane protein